MRFRVQLEEDSATGLFAARCLELSVFSQGRDEREALSNIREAIRLHLEAIGEEAVGKNLVEVEV